jgi:hypothetical protein
VGRNFYIQNSNKNYLKKSGAMDLESLLKDDDDEDLSLEGIDIEVEETHAQSFPRMKSSLHFFSAFEGAFEGQRFR